MEIFKYPHEVLTTPAKEVEITKELLKLADDMHREADNLPYCVGLASPQVGYPYKMFIALGQLYINPVITYYSKETEIDKEGCFSLEAGVQYDVERSIEIILQWQNKKGKICTGRFKDFPARVIQHEYDHLLGKLCNGK